jgi:hypothetical protein
MPISPDDDSEIRDLMARYCLYLDLEDIEAWIALFTPTRRITSTAASSPARTGSGR